MKKAVRAIATAASTLALLAGGTIWQLAFRAPAVDPRLTQATFFADLSTELRVTFTGMTLHELGELLRSGMR